jgi:hypothetical protein
LRKLFFIRVRRGEVFVKTRRGRIEVKIQRVFFVEIADLRTIVVEISYWRVMKKSRRILFIKMAGFGGKRTGFPVDGSD